MQYSTGRIGRIFVLRMNHGDRIPNTLESFAFEKKISCALCFFLGGVNDGSQIISGPSSTNGIPIEPILKVLSGIHESCAIGTILLNQEKKPKLHMHGAFGRNDKTIVGCVRMGVGIWKFGEVVVLEILNVKAYRKRNDSLGLDILEVEE